MSRASDLETLQRLANQGDASAQFQLGLRYKREEGPKQDDQQAHLLEAAEHWLIKAAKQGSAEAQCELGQMYLNDDATKVKKEEGIKWLRRSAENNYDFAKIQLGLMYQYGKWVAQNTTEAIHWYSMAANNGSSIAQRALAGLYKANNDLALARYWLIMAVNNEGTDSEATQELEQLNESEFREATHELNRLVGLSSVKTEIERIIAFSSVQRERRKVDLKNAAMSLHAVFSGNPGTGKTTVARLLGKIYAGLGLLMSGHVIEVHREDLVGPYLGQTESRTKAKIEEALDGVLFIDEAYTLNVAGPRQGDYGLSVINMLNTAMEDYRDRIAIVVAGYQKEMKEFLSTNDGLKSRFSNWIEFDDYTHHELLNIFLGFAHDEDYRVNETAQSRLEPHLIVAHSTRTRESGNARYVRNLFEEAKKRQAVRLSKLPTKDREALSTLTGDDFPL